MDLSFVQLSQPDGERVWRLHRPCLSPKTKGFLDREYVAEQKGFFLSIRETMLETIIRSECTKTTRMLKRLSDLEITLSDMHAEIYRKREEVRRLRMRLTRFVGACRTTRSVNVAEKRIVWLRSLQEKTRDRVHQIRYHLKTFVSKLHKFRI